MDGQRLRTLETNLCYSERWVNDWIDLTNFILLPPFCHFVGEVLLSLPPKLSPSFTSLLLSWWQFFEISNVADK